MYNQFEEEYNKIRKTYKELPELNNLDIEFDLSSFITKLESMPRHPLRFVRQCIMDSVGPWINYLHNFIIPNQSSAVLMEEFKHFNMDERKQMAKMIDKMMIIVRKGSLCSLEKDHKSDVKWIVETYQSWRALKPEIIEKVKKSISKWETA